MRVSGSSTRFMRALAQGGVTVEHRIDRTTGDGAHHQTAAGSGIAEIKRRIRLRITADTDAPHRPCALTGALDLGAERPHDLGRIDDVLALQQNRPMRVSPTVIAARINARCEIDLSPGTRMRPVNALDFAGGSVGGGESALKAGHPAGNAPP